MRMPLLTACAVILAIASAARAEATWIWPGDVPPSVQRAYAQHVAMRGDDVFATCPTGDGEPPVLREFRTFVAWEHEIDPLSASDRKRGITRRERYDVRYKQARVYDDLQSAWGSWYPLSEDEQVVFSELIATRAGTPIAIASGCRRPSALPAGA